MKAPAAALPDELVEEILLRLPPDEPAWLVRASLVCKSWGGAVCHRSFRRRLHKLHPAPPVLGFLHDWVDQRLSFFVPTTASPFSLPAPDRRVWHALDYRHGRALFIDKGWVAPELLLWEPITGGERRVPLPSVFDGNHGNTERAAAVFCAADDCDHHDCHGGPFQLVFVINTPDSDDEYDTLACVYSSETGTWGEPTSVHDDDGNMFFRDHSSLLVRRSLLYFLSDDGVIVEYDLARHGLALFYAPPIEYHIEGSEKLCLVLAEDGGMRLAQTLYPHLKFWKREEARDGSDAHWVLSRVIDLGSLLQIGAVVDEDTRVLVVGFAEGANVIFVTTGVGLFTVELLSERVRKVCDNDNGFGYLVPVVGFYTPMPRGEQQDEQPQQLFDKGSNAIVEEDSVGFSNALKTRVPSYKEVALECASTEYGCALVQKSEANKDDAENTKTSDSDVEDSAAPSRKDHSEEVLS